MRGTRRSTRRRALIEIEKRPYRKNNDNNDYTKKATDNGLKINASNGIHIDISDHNNSSDNRNKTSNNKLFTKMFAALVAGTFATLLVFSHYSAMVQGGIRPVVGSVDGMPQDALDTEAVTAAFAQKHAEDIIGSLTDRNLRPQDASSGKQQETTGKSPKENPEYKRKNKPKNSSVGKTPPPIPAYRGSTDKNRNKPIDDEGDDEHYEENVSNLEESSDMSKMSAKEKIQASELKTVGVVTMTKTPQELRREEEEEDFLSETWSEDGKIHCVEESPDLIQCHTHDDVEEDENFIKGKIEKQTKKISKNNRTPFKPTRSGIPNRFAGNNVTDSQGKKSSPWRGFSRENQPDGLLLPTDKISDRKRPLVRLDLTKDEPKVINVDTGEVKPLKMLNETEDVEIDSLVSTYKPRRKRSKSGVPVIEQSLQDVLTELRAKNYMELDIDYEEKLLYRKWKNDDHCHRFATRFGLNVPEVDLVSYPRSGSSWLRYLLEAATGVFTGTAHASDALHKLGFLGESEPPYTRRTLTLRTHSTSANQGVNRQAVQGGRDNVPAILLIRNPADAIASHWQAKNTSEQDAASGKPPIDIFQAPEFHDFTKEELEKWEQMYSNRLLWSRSVHVLHYDDLLRRPLLELLKVLRFLQLPPPSGGRLFCLRKHIQGRLKERKTEHDPYTTYEEDAVWSSVTRVAALLQLRDLDLPSYHTPLADYPPDRIYKSFIKRLEEDDGQQGRQRDEL